ncbi:hypothetical protein B0J13DRAFT_533710 [Dactylonectria estremocensis]|uniref:Uncharacterized protein n=1 Tax=Dactylonectria estremocensis TaxID=1079267 RepID=A0A9P9D7C7_9HYPO|nr:hypothetical protein B0J13DRAFT_533710 [Dactylonectria estremocensis]
MIIPMRVFLNERVRQKDVEVSSEAWVTISDPPTRGNPSFAPDEFTLPTDGGHRMWPRVSKHTNDSVTCGIPGPLSWSVVIQLNTCNALAYNGRFLGIRAETRCDLKRLSPFNEAGSCTVDERCPLTLHPTIIQQTNSHHPWVDLLPLPRMRDNLIQAFQIIDEREIGIDIVSVQVVASEKPTLIVWNDPSNTQSWEASPGFLRKWGHL